VVTPDDLTLYFASSRAGSEYDVYVSHRASATTAFGAPTAVSELNSPNIYDAPSWVSKDDCVIYLMSTRDGGAGGVDIYTARRPP
jgi:hypothetical protein